MDEPTGEDHFLESISQCVYGPENEIAAVTFCEKWRSFNKKQYSCKCNGMAGFRGRRVKFDICGEMNPLVFSALEGLNLVFTLMVSSTVMVDIVFARFRFCTFYWR